MSRLALNNSLTTRPLRSLNSSVSSQAAQPAIRQRPAAQSPFQADRFEQGASRPQASQLRRTDGQPQINQNESITPANAERALARVAYKKLKEQGPPQRLDYPLTLKGQLEYKKDTKDYNKRLFELAVKAGYIVT
ncbi:MAG TPA: hypothetical protein VF815_39145 [Myxococcaceae bacterium]|jgi:hypothetical protein